MSDEKKSCCHTPEAEPTVTRSAAPMWIIVVTLTLLFFGGLYLDTHSGWFDAKVYFPYRSGEQLEAYQPKSGAAAQAAQGKKVCRPELKAIAKTRRRTQYKEFERAEIGGYQKLMP